MTPPPPRALLSLLYYSWCPWLPQLSVCCYGDRDTFLIAVSLLAFSFLTAFCVPSIFGPCWLPLSDLGRDILWGCCNESAPHPTPSSSIPVQPSVFVCVCTLVTVFLYSGIEQSLSVHSGEAENIYENPEDIRQVMNSTKYLLMIFALIFPTSPSPLWYLLPSLSPPPLPSSLYSALFLPSSASVFLRLQVSLPLCHLMFIKPVFSPPQAPPQGPVYMVSYYALTHMQALCMHVSVQVTVTHIFTSAYKVSFSLLHPP